MEATVKALFWQDILERFDSSSVFLQKEQESILLHETVDEIACSIY